MWSAQCGVHSLLPNPVPVWSAQLLPNPAASSSDLTGAISAHRRALPSTVYSVQCTVYSVQRTAYSVQRTAYSVQRTAYSVEWLPPPPVAAQA